MRRAVGAGVLLVVLWSCASAFAAIPRIISYQGKVTDSAGVPVEGAHELTFRIYDAETAGNLLWQETHAGVVVDRGLFSVFLGGVADLNLSFDDPYFLEIKVDSEVMAPRQRITAAGYAIKAEGVRGADNVFPGTGQAGIWTTNPLYPFTIQTGGWGFAQTGYSVVATYSDSSAGYIGTVNNMNFQILTNSAAGKFVVTTTGNVGIGTSTPSNILTVKQGSATDPIADSWLVHPCDRKAKEDMGEVKGGKLDELKQIAIHKFKRRPVVDEDEVKQALGPNSEEISAKEARIRKRMKKAPGDSILKTGVIEKDGRYFELTEPTTKQLDLKRKQIQATKAKMPKFAQERVGILIDDSNIPEEILYFDEQGNKAGIDLLAYVGYLHAALKEAAERIEKLERQRAKIVR